MRGIVNIGIGLAILLVGLVITLGSYSAASGGGTYVIAYGAIAVGVLKLFQGLFQAVRAKARTMGRANRVALVAALVAFVVMAAGYGIGYRIYTNSTGYLVATLTQSPDSSARRAALEKISARNEPQAISAMIGALGDSDTYLRGEAALALRELGAADAVQPLIDSLPLQEGYIRDQFIGALGAFADLRSVPVLLAETDSESTGSSETYVAAAFSHFGPEIANDMIVRLSSPSMRARRVAVSVLRGMAARGAAEYDAALAPATPGMATLLYDDPGIASEAAIFLAYIDNEAARATLASTLGEADIGARETAASAIAKYMKGGVGVLANAFAGTDQPTRYGAAFGLGEAADYSSIDAADRSVAKSALEKAVAAGDFAAGCGAYPYYVRSARQDALDFLVGALNSCGDETMAEFFRNSGDPRLALAAEDWGRSFGDSVPGDTGTALSPGKQLGGKP